MFEEIFEYTEKLKAVNEEEICNSDDFWALKLLEEKLSYSVLPYYICEHFLAECHISIKRELDEEERQALSEFISAAVHSLNVSHMTLAKHFGQHVADARVKAGAVNFNISL